MPLSTVLRTQFTKELDEILAEYSKAAASSKYDDLSDINEKALFRMTTRARAAVERTAGPSSDYGSQLAAILSRTDQYDWAKLSMVMGVVDALRADLEAGYLHTLPELIHAELFGDFLEMADHLLEEGYRDAAAVLAGGTLESHIRQLCYAHGVSVESSTATGPRPKKAEQLNSDLAHQGAISKIDSKNVTAWLGLRNSAAHAKYADYSQEQVRILVTAVRDFITRNPG